MRLLRRNTVLFEYWSVTGTTETLVNGLHTGNRKPTYDDPVQYRGHISAPSGFATDNLFGINTQYTHVLLVDKKDADIQEDGIITFLDNVYAVKAVRPTMNVLAVALQKTTKNHAPEGWQPTGPTGATGATGETGGE